MKKPEELVPNLKPATQKARYHKLPKAFPLPQVDIVEQQFRQQGQNSFDILEWTVQENSQIINYMTITGKPRSLKGEVEVWRDGTEEESAEFRLRLSQADEKLKFVQTEKGQKLPLRHLRRALSAVGDALPIPDSRLLEEFHAHLLGDQN